jgi:tetratricopeptide (TPR) repeat protein
MWVDAGPLNIQTEDRYATIFENYIGSGLVVSLARVHAAQTGVMEADRQQAWHLLSYALQAPATWPGARDLLLALAPKMQMAGFRHDWLAYLEQGLVAGRAAGDSQAEAALNLEIGELRRHLGQYAEAEVHFTAALGLAQQSGDRAGEAAALVCLANLANLAYLTQRLDEAMRLADATLALVVPEDVVGGRAFFVKGLVHDSRRHFEEAETSFRQSQAIWALANDKRWVALCQQNLAHLAQERMQFDEALEAYGQAALLLDEIGDQQSIAIVAMNQGIVHFLSAEYGNALALYRRTEAIHRQYYDLRGLAMVCNNIALVLRETRDWPNAESYYQQSVEL